MRTEFKNGELILIPESELEDYALKQWQANGADARIRNFKQPDELTESVISLLKEHKKVEAVKVVRESTGWGLQECKDYVDNLI